MTNTEKNALREIDCYGGFRMTDTQKGMLLMLAIYSCIGFLVYLAGGLK